MITAPLVVLLGIAVFLLVRYGRTTILAAVVCSVFGLLLASTSWGAPVRNGVGQVTGFVESAVSGAAPDAAPAGRAGR